MFKNGIQFGLGFILVLLVSGISYAAFTWAVESDVITSDVLTSESWNNVLNNQKYLKQEVESIAFNDEGHSFTTNGYQKLGNGLIMQWGTYAENIGTTIDFPIAFPNGCLNITGSVYTTLTTNYRGAALGDCTTTGFIHRGSYGPTYSHTYFAIGY